MNINIRMNPILQMYVIGIPILYFLSVLYSFIGDTFRSMTFGFSVCYFVTIVYAIRYFGVISLYSIFLYVSVFFVYSNLILQSIVPSDGMDILEYTYPISVKFSEYEGFIFVSASFLQTYVMHVVYCLTKNTGRIWKVETKQNHNYIKAGILIMIIFLLPTLVKIIIEVRYVMANGYAAIFLGYRDIIEYPFWVSGAKGFFTAGYYVFLAGNPNKKQFLKVTIIYGFIMALGALMGQRAGLITFLLITVYWYTKKYNVEVKVRSVIGFGFALFAIIVFLNLLRNTYGTNDSIQDLELELVLTKLIGQSGSSVVPLFIIRGDLDYHDFPFIFSPLLAPINFILYRNNQSIDAMQHTNDISDVITYNVNPTLYLNGGGVGGALLGEMYDCGGFLGIVFWSAILAYIIRYFDYKHLNIESRYVPLIYAFLASIPMMPRGRFFGFTTATLSLVTAYLIMLLLAIIAHKRKVDDSFKER